MGAPVHAGGLHNLANNTGTANMLQVEHPLLHFLDSTTTVSTIVANAANPNTKEHYQSTSDRCTQMALKCVESPDRPFVCGVCRRAFSQQSTLTNHLKTHTGEKPYKCKVCESHFRQVATLNNHMKIHTGEKPYNCSYCPKQFRQKSTLVNHIRIHTC